MAPIAYPLQYVLNFMMAIILGGVFFFVYIYYLRKFHTQRVRQVGPNCPDPREITDKMCRHPPNTLHQKYTDKTMKPTINVDVDGSDED